jgi:uncharacterized caspase-like protein
VKALALAFAIVLVAAGALAQSANAQPDRRVALVIGNAQYQHAAPLANPVRDAIGVAAALNQLGFEVVVARDTDRGTMERALREFGRKLEGATVALFFYAGHGIQVDGENWLLPVDARLDAERDVPFEAVRLGLALAQMEDDSRTSIVILDACRENPFRARLGRGRSGGVRPGLATVEAGLGTLIAYSTQPNAVAYDGPTDGHSPFTGALLRRIDEPGVELRRLLTLVRADVVQATARRQVPWDHSSLMGDFFFVPTPVLAMARQETARQVQAPAPPVAAPAVPAAATPTRQAPELAPGVSLTPDQRVHVQRALVNLGFDQNGRSIGPGWAIHPGAIRRLQRSRGEPSTGELDAAQAAFLLASADGARATAREAEIALPFVQFSYDHARWFFNPLWVAMREHARAAGVGDCRGRACVRAVQEKLGQNPTGIVSQALLDAMAAAPVAWLEPVAGTRMVGDWRLHPRSADGLCVMDTPARAIAGPSLDPTGLRVFFEARTGLNGFFARGVDFDPASGPQVQVGRQQFPLSAFSAGQWLTQPMREATAEGGYRTETRLFRAIAAAQTFEIVGPARWGSGLLRVTYSARGFTEALRQVEACTGNKLDWALRPTEPDAGPVPLTRPSSSPTATRAAADLAQGVAITPTQRVQASRALHGLGHQAEGFADPWRLLRAQAVVDFQKSRREEATGRLSRAQVNALLAGPHARQPTAWEEERDNPLMRLSVAHDLLWSGEWPAAAQARAYAAAAGLSPDCTWRDCLGLIQRHFRLRETRMLDGATFRAMGTAPRALDPGGAESEKFGDWRFIPARGSGECVLAAAPRRIEGVSHWAATRIEFRRNPAGSRTAMTAHLAGFVDFSPDDPPWIEAGGEVIPLEPAWGNAFFRGARLAVSGEGWTLSAAPHRALATHGEVAVAGRTRWGGTLRLVYATDGFKAGFARLDDACGGGALAAAWLGAARR